MIDDKTIDKVKDASNVADVIKDFYDLKKSGPNLTCLCPFHSDKHIGSFIVSERKNMYTCYSCGAHGGPVDFLMSHENLSFPDAIRWLGKKYGIEVDGADKFKPKPCTPHEPTPPLPMLTIPTEWVQHTLGKPNTLTEWIESLNWKSEQRKRIPAAIKNYMIGTGKEGHCIFWQIDDEARIRTGKMMLYKPDGHRDKESPHSRDWIHAMMYRNGKLDPMEAEYNTCYFGQHLLKLCPGATICLVESEKTALICSIAYGGIKDRLWVATGGLQFFNAKKLEPFIKQNRKIVAYPDKDGVDEWKRKVKEIGYKHLHINTDVIRDYWTEEDGPKADLADIIVRLIKPKGPEADLKAMVEKNPAVQDLIDTFQLTILDK